jgi:hypothetical protein
MKVYICINSAFIFSPQILGVFLNYGDALMACIESQLDPEASIITKEVIE